MLGILSPLVPIVGDGSQPLFGLFLIVVFLASICLFGMTLPWVRQYSVDKDRNLTITFRYLAAKLSWTCPRDRIVCACVIEIQGTHLELLVRDRHGLHQQIDLGPQNSVRAAQDLAGEINTMLGIPGEIQVFDQSTIEAGAQCVYPWGEGRPQWFNPMFRAFRKWILVEQGAN